MRRSLPVLVLAALLLLGLVPLGVAPALAQEQPIPTVPPWPTPRPPDQPPKQGCAEASANSSTNFGARLTLTIRWCWMDYSRVISGTAQASIDGLPPSPAFQCTQPSANGVILGGPPSHYYATATLICTGTITWNPLIVVQGNPMGHYTVNTSLAQSMTVSQAGLLHLYERHKADFRQTLYFARQQLVQNTNCRNALSGPLGDALVVLDQMIARDAFYEGPYSGNGDVARATEAGGDSDVLFFQEHWEDADWFNRVLTILHELGHATRTHAADHATVDSAAYDAQIDAVCVDPLR